MGKTEKEKTKARVLSLRLNGEGLKIPRMFTKTGENPLDVAEYTLRTSTIRNPDGSVVFELKDIEVPKGWSQVATDILSQKYFRKAGVPQTDENGMPKLDENGKPVLGSERSVKQVVRRMAGCWRFWGEKYGYFASEADAQAFEDEIAYMLLYQYAAPNSPQWFNTGLAYAYGIEGTPQGHWYVDPVTGELAPSTDAYTRPQGHACFIQSLNDDLVNEGGIFDLVLREARVFKYGSGTGSNFSSLRAKSEKLSGGGSSSGLMSFLKIFDRAAGAIKSGGTTRRAAKMVIVNADHPEIEDFIMWKVQEEAKVASLFTGSRTNNEHLNNVMQVAVAQKTTDWKENTALRKAVVAALADHVPFSYIIRAMQLVEQGQTKFDLQRFDMHYEGLAYQTVSGQNSNNSIRIPHTFMESVDKNGYWDLTARTDGRVMKTMKATELYDKIAFAAWSCADPGLQFDDTIQEWHTCRADGKINATNPCSEYVFLDDTACNLASLNLMKFLNEEKGQLEVEKFLHATRLWTLVLEITVLMAQFPSREIAQRSYEYRTLGLGYANLGTVLMVLGIPYDSPEARAIAGAITAMMCGESYAASAEMAKYFGAFRAWDRNREDMLRVIRNHRRASYAVPPTEYEQLHVTPMAIDAEHCPPYLLEAAQGTWDRALENGEQFGYRNAQVTVIAPTGTIALVMDCDTTGIEPDFAIVKYKKLAGGGYFKIVNQSVHKALQRLGYTAGQIKEIEDYCRGHGTLQNAPHVNFDSLRSKGFTDEKLAEVEKQMPNTFDIQFVFNKFTLGEDFCMQKLGFTQEQLNDPQFNMLEALGFTKEQIRKANDHICGTMTIESAPHLKAEHYAVFDCANKCGKYGKRFIHYDAHLGMMAAVQPFISGAISKTINMPHNATVDDVKAAYSKSWKYMLKAIALYRDGSKLSQPLNSIAHEEDELMALVGREENDINEQADAKQLHEAVLVRGQRKKLPAKRDGFVQEARIGGHKLHLRTGEYPDGSLGEIFIDMYKEGASYRSLLNCFAISVSKGLQYGVPLEEYIETFSFTRFEPSGVAVGDENIKNASSILDYVFRVLDREYVSKDMLETPDSKPVLQSTPKTAPKILASSTGSPAKTSKPGKTEDDLIDGIDARVMGYTGEQCGQCGSMKVKRNGSCSVCTDCGETTGCS